MKTKHLYSRAARAFVLGSALTLALSGCSASDSQSKTANVPAEQIESVVVKDVSTDTTASAETGDTAEAVASAANVTTDGVIDTTDLFTDRDLEQVADTSSATQIDLSDGQNVSITQEGVYVLSGTASNVTVSVDVDSSAKVQLVLNGVSITNTSVPAIYVKSADKVFVTTVAGTTNTLSVTGEFVADGDTNTDAVIFSKDDLVLNGQGALAIESTDNGITSKDDLKVCGGTISITCQGGALEANDSVAVADGSITINTAEDGIHAENDEDDTVGYVYICGGTINITAGDDAVHATTYLQIDGGSLSIDAAEALEATYIQVNGGTTNITASDDGVNASYKSSSVGTPTIEVRGGELTVSMGQGDTDAIDSNGNVIVSGGAIDITAQFAFDFDGQSSFTGGTITVNGEQVSEISNSMMMGGGMMGGPGMGRQGGPMG